MSTISNLASTDAPLWNTPKNHGPLVSVISWFLGITAFLSILARVATRVAVVRQLRWDDASIMFAMVSLCYWRRGKTFANCSPPASVHCPDRHHFSAGVQWPGSAH